MTDHLSDAGLTGIAVDHAIGTGAAVAIGATPIHRSALRKRPADFGADTLELLGGMFVQRDISRQSRTAEANDAYEDKGHDQI